MKTRLLVMVAGLALAAGIGPVQASASVSATSGSLVDPSKLAAAGGKWSGTTGCWNPLPFIIWPFLAAPPAAPNSVGCPSAPSCPYANPMPLNADQTWTVTPPSGTPGNVEVSFGSSNPWDTGSNWDSPNWVEFDGTSNAFWWGSSPYNADSVELDDTFTVTSSDTSTTFTVQVPAGAGFSVTQSPGKATVDETSTVNNDFRNAHDFQGIRFDAHNIDHIYETATAKFNFGYQQFIRAVHSDSPIGPNNNPCQA